MNKTTNKLRAAVIITLINLLACTSIFAQAPEKMSYQAVVRNSSDALVSNQQVGMQISILKGSPTGTAVYVEIQTPTTNANGLVSIELGNGAVVSGVFASIDWANGPYFIKTETDLTGGTNYTITGTSQMMSVPYALYAKNGISNGTQAGEMQYWNGSAWVNVAPGSEGATLKMIGSVPTWVAPLYSSNYVHCEGNTTTVVNVTSPTGKVWMDRNLGANHIATTSTDATSYGDLYQWGRFADGHQCRSSTTTATLSSSDTPGNGDFITVNSGIYDWRTTQNNNLWQGVNGINNPCPTGYRLPTYTELNAEIASWSSQDAAGAFASPLKLPLAGGREYYNGSLFDVGSFGLYWSSTINGSNIRLLILHSNILWMTSDARAHGLSVRCLRD